MNTGQLTFETMLSPGSKPAGKCYANATENHGRGEKDAVRLARGNDPSTSKEAARRLYRSGRLVGQRRIVLRTLSQNDGSTSAEISAKIGDDRYLASRRMKELEEANLVKRGRTRICRTCGNMCLVWWILDKERVKHLLDTH